MTRTPLLLIVTLLSVPMLHASAQDRAAFSTLDYSKEVTKNGMTFVPLLHVSADYQEGIAFFNSFYNEVSTPIANGPDVSYIEIFVYPKAYQEDAKVYNAFFENTPLVDKQQFWFVSSHPCGLSSALDKFFSGFPEELQPTVRVGGYPQVCYAQMYYRNAQQAELMALLQSNRGITVHDALPLCAANSPKFATKPIVDFLKSGDVFRDEFGRLIGNYMEIASEVRRYREMNPSKLTREAEAAFMMDAFEPAVDPDERMLKEEFSDRDLTACKRIPFLINYGD